MRIIALLVLTCTLCSCTSTKVECGTFKVSRISFMQSVDVKASVDDKGNFSIIYGNDGGGSVAGTAAGVAIKTVVR